MRADQLLVQRGLAASRSQAARLIDAGARWQRMGHGGLEWKRLSKSDDVPEDAPIELANDDEARFVSRGGLKLEGALNHTGVQVQGLRCLDVGQSTGGFTDCLLQRGAAYVTGIDVGHGQVHPRISADERVRCIEGVNARTLDATLFIAEDGLDTLAPEGFDFITGDVSFISLTLVLPAVAPLLKSGCDMLMLVKPQFELQPEHIGKGGLVKNPADYAVVEKRLHDCCKELGLGVLAWFDSPIKGGDGNREFFIHARRPL